MGKAIQSYYWQKVFIKICRGKDAVDLAVGSRESQSKRAVVNLHIAIIYLLYMLYHILYTISNYVGWSKGPCRALLYPYCTVRSMHSVHLHMCIRRYIRIYLAIQEYLHVTPPTWAARRTFHLFTSLFSCLSLLPPAHPHLSHPFPSDDFFCLQRTLSSLWS